jgi:hypothetical protein
MRPVLVINPRHDGALRERANQAVADGAQSPQALAAALRPDYPEIVVHRRELVGERTSVWYVYREGHWIRDE